MNELKNLIATRLSIQQNKHHSKLTKKERAVIDHQAFWISKDILDEYIVFKQVKKGEE